MSALTLQIIPFKYFGVRSFLFFKEIDTYIQQRWLNIDQNVTLLQNKCFISYKCCSFELYIHQRILKQMYYGFHKIIKQHNCFQNGK